MEVIKKAKEIKLNKEENDILNKAQELIDKICSNIDDDEDIDGWDGAAISDAVDLLESLKGDHIGNDNNEYVVTVNTVDYY